MAHRMGMRFDRSNQIPLDTIIGQNNGSFTLGPYATSPLDLASAYSTLAANGTQCVPTPVTEILDRTGAPLTGADGAPLPLAPVCTPDAVPPPIATTLNQILVGDTALPIGTGTRAAIPGHQIAGKTGTSQNRFSVAFVGYTPRYAASVMVLNPKRNEDLGGYGGRLAAPIWHDAMLPIVTAEPPAPFPPPGLQLEPPQPPRPLVREPPRRERPPAAPPPAEPPPAAAPPPAEPPPAAPPSVDVAVLGDRPAIPGRSSARRPAPPASRRSLPGPAR
jgi:membrane peptidoglycan carboxypeptidase